MEKTKKQMHPFTMLLIILVIATILSNFIPSGMYERIQLDDRTIVDPESFHYVDKIHVGIKDFFISFYEGFSSASSLMAMIFFAGGAFGVINGIGLLETVLKRLAHNLKDKSFGVLSFILMAVIGTQVAFTSMWELCVVILPMIIPLVLSLGYDVIVGAAIVMLASCAGFGAAMTNPLFTAVAHKIAELPIYSAIWYRGISFVIILLVCWLYLMRYARKVKEDSTKSYMFGIETKYKAFDEEIPPVGKRLKFSGVITVLMFVFLIYGTVKLGFDFPEIAATFVAMSFIIGFSYGLNINEICNYFGEGMQELFYAGMVMLFARAILYILEKSMVIDVIIHFLASKVVGFNPIFTGIAILVIQTIINFFIPSGSGQAAITIPIMVPIADLGNVTRQVACLASQFGDGFSNFMYPTNGSLIAILSVAGIPYNRWFKFFAPLFLTIMIISSILVTIAVKINLGPF